MKQNEHKCGNCFCSVPDEYGNCVCKKFDKNNFFKPIICNRYIRIPKWLNHIIIMRKAMEGGQL